jgi:6-pyruvoyltetrahydropterin/6-carboxytetrahydropterin synthase
VKVAKEFDWEMGHRLSFHKGKCKNLHGHSYKLLVEFEGEQNKNGIVIDYYDIKSIVTPLIESLDHAFMINKNDTELLNALSGIKTKLVIVDYESTAENICNYFLNEICKIELPKNIVGVKVRVYEQAQTYAEGEIKL